MLMLIAEIYAVLVAGSFLFIGYVLARPLLAALWYRLTGDPDVYPPECAEAPKGCRCGAYLDRLFIHSDHVCDPVAQHFKTAPTDDLDTAIDWHRYEYELKRKQT